MSTGHRIGNALLYQGAWFACVLGAARGRPTFGLIAVLAIVLVHLARARRPSREMFLIAIAAAAGALFESLLVASGWVHMGSELLVARVTPLWMVALWVAFSTTLNVALRPLRTQYLLGAIIASGAAPIAYMAGASLGALQLVDAAPALLAIALAWAVGMPVMMRCAQRFDGFTA